MFHPIGIGREPRILDHVVASQHRVAQRSPLALVLDTEEYGAVGGAERTVRRDRWMFRRGAARWFVAIAGEIGGLAHPLSERIDHRDVQTRPDPGARPVVERGED